MFFTLRVQCLGHRRRLWEDWGKKDRERLREVTCQTHTARGWQSWDMCPGPLAPGPSSLPPILSGPTPASLAPKPTLQLLSATYCGGCRCLAPDAAGGAGPGGSPHPRGLQPLRDKCGKEGDTSQGLRKGTWLRQARGRVGGSSGYREGASHRGNSGVVRGQGPGGGGPGPSGSSSEPHHGGGASPESRPSGRAPWL